MKYLVLTTEYFEQQIIKLRVPDIRIQKICDQLSFNPYAGKPLTYSFLREKRFNRKRIYYLVYDEFNVILVISIGNKKIQQHTIDDIKNNFSFYKKYVEDQIKKIRS